MKITFTRVAAFNVVAFSPFACEPLISASTRPDVNTVLLYAVFSLAGLILLGPLLLKFEMLQRFGWPMLLSPLQRKALDDCDPRTLFYLPYPKDFVKQAFPYFWRFCFLWAAVFGASFLLKSFAGPVLDGIIIAIVAYLVSNLALLFAAIIHARHFNSAGTFM